MFLRKNKAIIFLFFVLSMQLLAENPLKLKAENINKKVIESYWDKLKAKSNKLYKGLDLSVEVATGIYKRDDAFDEEDYTGEIKVKVPIYSKSEKRGKEEKKREFLDKGAELLKDLEVNVNRIKILREKEAMLKTIMMEEGVRSIEAYHKVREDRISVEAEIDELLRKLDSMLM